MARNIPGTGSLRAVEAAGRLLSFTRAASELNLTPAAISHQIKEFEEQIGVRLFTRTSRTMRLTAAGEVLHAAISEALENLTRAVARLQRTRNAARIKVTASASIAAKWLVPRL